MGLNFNPFNGMQGGYGEGDNKQDFFAPIWSDRTGDEWGRFLHGDYKWDDYLINPGSVIANPAGQIADPGNFFSGDWYRNELKQGNLGDRTTASAIIAGLIYGGSTALGAMGSGGSGAAGGSAGGGTGVSSATAGTGVGEAAAGGTGTAPAAGGGFFSQFKDPQLWMSVLGQGGFGGGQQPQQDTGGGITYGSAGPMAGSNPGREGGELMPTPKSDPYKLQVTPPTFKLGVPDLSFDRKMLQAALSNYGG